MPCLYTNNFPSVLHFSLHFSNRFTWRVICQDNLKLTAFPSLLFIPLLA